MQTHLTLMTLADNAAAAAAGMLMAVVPGLMLHRLLQHQQHQVRWPSVKPRHQISPAAAVMTAAAAGAVKHVVLAAAAAAALAAGAAATALLKKPVLLRHSAVHGPGDCCQVVKAGAPQPSGPGRAEQHHHQLQQQLHDCC